MPSKSPTQRLHDILDNIYAIDSFLGDYDLEALTRDRKTLYAIIRALEIISEATRRIPDAVKDNYDEIDWVAVAAAGNIYRHEYDAVDEAIIWHTVKVGLAPLRAFAQFELKRLGIDA